jgi:hypothetical protein
MNRSTRTVEGVIEEVQGAVAHELMLVAQRDINFVRQRALMRYPIALEVEVVTLTHVEVQINRID